MANRPDRTGQTATVNEHGLTAVEGRFHALVWQCRTCDQRRSEKLAFMDTPCE